MDKQTELMKELIGLIRKHPKAELVYKLDDDISLEAPEALIINKVYTDFYGEYDGEVLIMGYNFEDIKKLCMSEKCLYLKTISRSQLQQFEEECIDICDWNECIVIDRGV